MFEPELPRITQPIYQPRTATALLTEPAEMASWQQAGDERIHEILASEKAKLEGAKLSLAEWRRAEGVRLVEVVGVPGERLQALQAELLTGAQEMAAMTGLTQPTLISAMRPRLWLLWRVWLTRLMNWRCYMANGRLITWPAKSDLFGR